MQKKMSILQKTNMFIRSILFSSILIGTVIPYSFLCKIAGIFSLRVRNVMVTGWTDFMVYSLKKVCRIDYKIEGLEHIPKDRNGIVLSKHQSTWETLFLPSYFHQVAIIIKKELLWVPFFGWGLAAIEPIAINRSDTSSAMEQILTQGKKYLDAGRWILIFPEGTRMLPGVVGKYRVGGAKLATTTGYPILPVAHNAGRYWSKRQFMKIPGTVNVVFGPLIETKGRKPEEVLAEVKDWIEKTMVRIDGGKE